MARMSIDDMLGRDPRLLHLADAMGDRTGERDRWDRRYTAGVLILDVWPLCYDRVSPELPERDIDRAAGVAGFANAMIDAGLAQRAGERVHVAGVEERIAYLKTLRQSAIKAGRKSGESRRNKDERARSENRTGPFRNRTVAVQKTNGTGNPLVPDSVPDAAVAFVPDPVPVPEKETRGARDGWEPDPWDEPEVPRQRAASQVAIDYFHERYRAAYEGHAPNWSGRAAATVARLAKRHGADEVCARVDRLFDGRGPSWLQPPYTVNTLSSQWDALAVDAPARGGRAENGVEYAMRRAREADDRIRRGDGGT